MGKMPEGLRKYWAKHGRGRKVRRSGKVVRMARRRYFGKKRRGGKTTIPIMGLATAATVGTSILASPNKEYGRLTPLDSLTKYGPSAFGTNVASKLRQTETYMPMLVPLVIWGVGRVFLGKRKIWGRISLF